MLLALCVSTQVFAADDIATTAIRSSDFQSVHEALVEAIEAEGLVVAAVIPFNDMLTRTAKQMSRGRSPFLNAEIVQFCSSELAWQLLEEDATHIALCPLSITLYELATDPGTLVLAYRNPGNTTLTRIRAEALLRRLLERSAELARLRW